MTKLNTLILLIAGLFVTTINNAGAAIVYTDVADYTMSWDDTYELDFDGDGSPEGECLELAPSSWPHISPTFIAANWGSDCEFTSASATNVDNLVSVPFGDLIDINTGWYMINDSYLYGPTTGGPSIIPFPAGTDEYIGVKFNGSLGTGIRFGWIRVEWDGADVFIIKDFAYETITNEPIAAGDMGNGSSTGLSIVASEEIQVYPNPASEFIFVDGKANPISIEFYSINGKLVQKSKLDKIDVSNLRSGNYIMVIKLPSDVIIRKNVIVE